MKFFTDGKNVLAFNDHDDESLYKHLVEITEKEAMEMSQPKEPSVTQVLDDVKKSMRGARAPMLDALTGIAGRASRCGDAALAAEADALSESLLNTTDDPSLNAAQTKDEMEAAGLAAYKRIAAAASPALRVVFREITGA